jgi:hypothetical protein
LDYREVTDCKDKDDGRDENKNDDKQEEEEDHDHHKYIYVYIPEIDDNMKYQLISKPLPSFSSPFVVNRTNVHPFQNNFFAGVPPFLLPCNSSPRSMSHNAASEEGCRRSQCWVAKELDLPFRHLLKSYCKG